jgi:hypothetical protein
MSGYRVPIVSEARVNVGRSSDGLVDRPARRSSSVAWHAATTSTWPRRIDVDEGF